MSQGFNHFDENGNAVMVDVSGKNVTYRTAVATGEIHVGEAIMEAVKEGSVKKGDVLCIIEAMKLMNEIESEFDGEVAEIFIKDGEAVEYGKPLFKII